MPSQDLNLPGIQINRNLLERLRQADASGCLYGLPGRLETKDSYLIWTATGSKEGLEKEEMQVLTEIFPCGIDPIGVFVGEDQGEDAMMALIDQLPETFLEVTDPVVLQKSANGDFKAQILVEGAFEEIQFEEISNEEMENQIQLIRVKGNLSLMSLQTEADLQSAFKHLMEKVSCPYGTFRLENSDVFFLHIWETNKISNQAGWAATGNNVFGEDEETCHVTNIDENANELRDLWRFVQDEEEDDGFGMVKEKKKKIVEKETMNFQLLMKMSGEACSSKTLNCAPIIHYEKREGKNITIPIKIDSVGVVRKSIKIPDVMEVLKGCVQRQVHEMGRSLLSEFHLKNSTSLPELFHFKPEPLGHICSIIYNKRGTCASLAEFRKHIHKLFMLPIDRPLFRRMNSYTFQDDLEGIVPLRNVHIGLKNKSTDGEVCLVQGTYSYHHYMQDNFDDDKWGCAYRSLQTLISWFRHQGYTATSIPTHSEIQKCLVDMGDKPASFIGSKQWIGSTEVGFVLQKACSVDYKMLNVSSGEELASKGRDLAHHFKTSGTPIMIGGGQYAHTIIGVDWNEANGDTRWLILDPHYTGADLTSAGKSNASYIQNKGWVGWKGPEFWNKTAFYNMCMPQRPTQW